MTKNDTRERHNSMIWVDFFAVDVEVRGGVPDMVLLPHSQAAKRFVRKGSGVFEVMNGGILMGEEYFFTLTQILGEYLSILFPDGRGLNTELEALEMTLEDLFKDHNRLLATLRSKRGTRETKEIRRTLRRVAGYIKQIQRNLEFQKGAYLQVV